MKQLHNKVNIVPVIAKADVLVKKEILRLKKKVRYNNHSSIVLCINSKSVIISNFITNVHLMKTNIVVTLDFIIYIS